MVELSVGLFLVFFISTPVLYTIFVLAYLDTFEPRGKDKF